MHYFNYLHSCQNSLMNNIPEPAPSTHLAFLPKIYLDVMLPISPSVSPLMCPVYSERHVT